MLFVPNCHNHNRFHLTPREKFGLGGRDGVNLDGGGSTTMWIREQGQTEGRVVNQPSDGSERPVITALGVFSR
ncbi:MAG: phosphodiester glycosidase family protein [Planctomycetota bacterium]